MQWVLGLISHKVTKLPEFLCLHSFYVILMFAKIHCNFPIILNILGGYWHFLKLVTENVCSCTTVLGRSNLGDIKFRDINYSDHLAMDPFAIIK